MIRNGRFFIPADVGLVPGHYKVAVHLRRVDQRKIAKPTKRPGKYLAREGTDPSEVQFAVACS